MTEKKSPLDQALDLFVYAPVGLALSARDELPKLAERGRRQLDAQLSMARVIGQFAVGEAGRRVEQLTARQAAPPPPAAPSPPAPPSPSPSAAAARPSAPPAAPRPTRAADNGNGNGPVPSADSLAIHGYDALAASQVVQRLAGLSPEELAAVGAYEAATRHRKTILNRVEQLQADARA